MGLFSFAANAGKKLFGGKPEKTALEKEIKDLGLDASGIDIDVSGDKVVLSGDAVSQEAKEKVIMALGNVEGISAVEDTSTVAGGATGDITFHEVVKGDTLWAIAEKHLGNGAEYTKIFEANKPMLKDPDEIYPGQRLRIVK